MRKIFVKLADYFGSAWRLAVLDMAKGRWIVDPAPSRIGYLKAENANGRHILMQPVDESRYLLADDLCWERICRQHRHADRSWKPGRMVVETSPRNYQVWIRSQRPLSLDEKRYWLKRMGSDPGADPNDRWGRCPGFRNRKDKYGSESGRYPLARLIWIDWTVIVQPPCTVMIFLRAFIRQIRYLWTHGNDPCSQRPCRWRGGYRIHPGADREIPR